ncbi:MAG: CBS domain-containing protein [Thermodesulfobacteriota bacterium]|nr:CBS domain-containing protein [Thermodesulfobacteriota bacterium]
MESTKVKDVMTRSVLTIREKASLGEAVPIMGHRYIPGLAVTSATEAVTGKKTST